MEILITFLIAALVCGVVAFLVSRSVVKNQQKHYEQMLTDRETAQQQALEAKEQVLVQVREADKKALEAKEEAHGQIVEQLQRKYDETLKAKEDAHAQIVEQLQKKYDETIKAKDEANAQLMSELRKRFDETIAKMSAQLKDDTSKILKERQEELQKSSNDSLDKIVNPLKENLNDLQKALADGKKESAVNNVRMEERIKALIEQTDATKKSADELANALKHKTKMQGDWGELVLANLLTSQGLTEGKEFDVQATICDECGNVIKSDSGKSMRPDVILHLDNVREVIIDSKVSLTAYTEYVNAEDELSRKDALDKHVKSLRAHVDELSKKDYSKYIQAPKQTVDYVIMFVPISGALWSALNADKNLWMYAAEKKVYMADEQSLFGALKIVQLTWRQIAQVENQEKVYKLAEEMLNRVGQFLAYYNTMGKKLGEAQKSYDDGLKKLQDGGYSINTTAKQLLKLGVKSDNPEIKALPE